jgi:hypothetical protein
MLVLIKPSEILEQLQELKEKVAARERVNLICCFKTID